jgi:hypothetical protein
MIITVRKPVSHGLEVIGNYTLSKSTDNGQAGVTAGGEGFLSTDGVLDPFDMRKEQGYSATDSRNRFTTSIVYQPSFGQKYTGVLRQVLGGWGVSSSITATKGNRYSGGVQGTGQQTLGSATAVDGGMTGSAIQTTANLIGGRISWVPRNFFQYPNIYNVDFRLTKEFQIRERFSLEFRAEAFNLFNSTIVQGVNQNASNFAAPSPSTTTTPTPQCWNGAITSGSGPAAGTPVHANTCMVPVTAFQTATSTSGNLFGARQLQAGIRFNF